MSQDSIQHGDFTNLTREYSLYRAGYSDSILTSVLAMVGKPLAEIDFVDVGAGTGIWTRMVAARCCGSVVAVEPNDAMRAQGEEDSRDLPIAWRKGNGARTGLSGASADLVTMASSFHWVDFDQGIEELTRILRPGGWFAPLWNPRHLDESPVLLEIEGYISELRPDIERISSGRSGVTNGLTDRLWRTGKFDDVVYLENRHNRIVSRDSYIGAWRSANDVQAQLGPELFKEFLDRVTDRLKNMPEIETQYLTRCWAARRI